MFCKSLSQTKWLKSQPYEQQSNPERKDDIKGTSVIRSMKLTKGILENKLT